VIRIDRPVSPDDAAPLLFHDDSRSSPRSWGRRQTHRRSAGFGSQVGGNGMADWLDVATRDLWHEV